MAIIKDKFLSPLKGQKKIKDTVMLEGWENFLSKFSRELRPQFYKELLSLILNYGVLILKRFESLIKLGSSMLLCTVDLVIGEKRMNCFEDDYFIHLVT